MNRDAGVIEPLDLTSDEWNEWFAGFPRPLEWADVEALRESARLMPSMAAYLHGMADHISIRLPPREP